MAIRVQTKSLDGGRALNSRVAANDRIAEKAERLHFHSRVPMLCECDAAECRALVMIGLEDYRGIRQQDALLLAPGHRVEGADPLGKTPDYTIARQSDPPREGNGHRT